MDNKEYNNLKALTKSICKCTDVDDLLHEILIQLGNNLKYQSLPAKDKRWYFVRTVQNQYYSNNSKYYKQYKKYKFDQLSPAIELVEEEYKEKPTMDWIKETLETELILNPSFWYNKGIFELWMEHQGFIDRVHKQTKIPKYSIIETINEVKKLIKQKWIDYGKN